MTTAVFDTNVIVSGVLSPDGAPGRLLEAILNGFCRPVVTDAILEEYEEVLSREKFGFPAFRVHALIDALGTVAVHAPFSSLSLKTPLPDPDDRIFVEAVTAGNVPIVTGNIRHFPRSAVGRIPIFSPAAFLAQIQTDQR